MGKICNQCGLPGTFQKMTQKYKVKNGTVKTYSYERGVCNRCLYLDAKYKKFEPLILDYEIFKEKTKLL